MVYRCIFLYHCVCEPRPLLKQYEDKAKIDIIWKERREKYLYAADYEFNTDQKTPVQITSKIIETIFL